MSIINNKKALIRIIEASIAVLLILSAVLIIVSREKADFSRQEEIMVLERHLLSSITQDEFLRSEILSNNTANVKLRIESVLPAWANYSVRICDYKDICTLDLSLNKEVYADEALVLANLTYLPKNATKIKIFLWEK